MEKVKINDKYEILFNDGCDGKEFEFSVLRYGEEWRNLIGDNLGLAMFQVIQDLREENENMKSKIWNLEEELKDREEFWKRECNRD